MRFAPDATLPPDSVAAVAEAFGLGAPLASEFVARGAMGAVNQIRTRRQGKTISWTVKRSYWNHFTDAEIGREVEFTMLCAEAGILAPRSIPRVGTGSYVLTLPHQPDGGSQYRVLEWVDGEVGRPEDPKTIPPLSEWMARIHRLAVDPADEPVDDWFSQVGYDWDRLIGRVQVRAPDLAERMAGRLPDLHALTDMVNTTALTDTVYCHTDLGAENLVWSPLGPQLIDWENAGPLGPHQELGCRVRSLGASGPAAYRAYRQADGPAEITDPRHFATAVAVNLNYLGCQAELLLDDAHPEQHPFAKEQADNAIGELPDLGALEDLVKVLS